MLSILAAILLSQAWAQNVTASFDSTLVGENPAAAATREFGVISPFISAHHTKHIVVDPFNPTADLTWERNIDIQRYEGVFAAKGQKIVPELYASQNAGTVKVSTADGSQQSSTKINMFNYLINLAFRPNKKWNFGLTFFNPKMHYLTDATYTQSGFTRRDRNDMTMDVFGLGGGFTVNGSKWSFGGFYHMVSEGYEVDSTYQDDANPVSNSQYTSTLDHAKYGLGVAYQEGSSRGGGHRVEFSHSRFIEDTGGRYVDDTEKKNEMRNSRTALAYEVTKYGFTGGISLARVYGRYTNYRYFMDAVVEDVLSSTKPVDSLTGFIGFKAKGGSSFGGFISYNSGKELVNFVGEESLAEVTRYGGGISYVYAF